MSVSLALAFLAGICAVASLIDHADRPWLALGVLALAVALVI